MSVSISDILYTRISGTTNAMVGDGSTNSPNAVSSDFSGEAKILPYVTISGILCTVTEVSRNAFYQATKITNFIIPNTVTTLKSACFGPLDNVKEMIIPSSVMNVESFFITDKASEIITFCGLKEPNKNSGDSKVYISSSFKGSVNVPLGYEPWKTEFLYKKIKRTELTCPNTINHISKGRNSAFKVLNKEEVRRRTMKN